MKKDYTGWYHLIDDEQFIGIAHFENRPEGNYVGPFTTFTAAKADVLEHFRAMARRAHNAAVKIKALKQDDILMKPTKRRAS